MTAPTDLRSAPPEAVALTDLEPNEGDREADDGGEDEMYVSEELVGKNAGPLSV